MSDDRQRDIAIALLALSGLIIFLAQKEGGKIPLAGFAALAILAGVTLIFPLVGLALAIPIFFVVWFDHQKIIWAWWDKVKKMNISLGGN